MPFDHWIKRRPKAGDHIRVQRTIPYPPFVYYHHGIYVSDTEVINFNGEPGSKDDKPLGEQMKAALIIVSTIEEFLAGGVVEVNATPGKNSPEQVIAKARRKIGTKLGTYGVLKNNCEHFCNECRNNSHESKQVQKGVAGISALAALAISGITAAIVSSHKKDKNNLPLAKNDDEKQGKC